ncbi:ankyrin repeat domain-containing protein 53 [Castor canadensis]|uniref:Ankyrin repeat domain-containing protein 53 n=1 Tax=Castor canadensis TaxID=51338 RepID=A0AC58KJQ6_CASCN
MVFFPQPPYWAIGQGGWGGVGLEPAAGLGVGGRQGPSILTPTLTLAAWKAVADNLEDDLEAAADSCAAPVGDAAGSARRPSGLGERGQLTNLWMASGSGASLWARAGARRSGGEERRGTQPWQRAEKARRSSALSKESSPPPLTPPRADDSTTEPSDPRAIANYSELFAAEVGNVEWLRFCLNRDRRGITTDGKGFAAIHFAAQQGKLLCMQVLVEEYKFPVDLLTHNRQTPLHLAIRKDNKTMTLPCMHYLLKKGADINAQTCNGSTALHLAAFEGLLGCIKVLVQSGANVYAQDAIGCKPIDYCKIRNYRACARFLKDAMWKRDKKDFACEMEKLKCLKDKLTLMEHDYLIECQKEQKIQRQANFKKWLRSKYKCQTLVPNTKQEAGAQPWSSAHSKTPRTQISKTFQCSVEARLLSILQPKVLPKPIYKWPAISRPKSWNLSNNPARSPATDISCPQGIRLGMHPDHHKEHDFSSFLEVNRDADDHVLLRTVDGHLVAPVPQLPFEMIIRALYPRVQPYRMKVPQGLYPISIVNVLKKRHLGKDTFWTDTLAMNLRETFDEAFLTALQAHQVLPTLPSPLITPIKLF